MQHEKRTVLSFATCIIMNAKTKNRKKMFNINSSEIHVHVFV